MDPLVFDFSDRADMRAKLPAAQKRLTELEAALREQTREVEDWREIVALLMRRADQGSASSSVPEVPKGPWNLPPREAQPLDLVVEVVNRDRRKIRSKDVAHILRQEGHDLVNNVVSNALFYAANRADPPRVVGANELGRGFYAPLGFNANDEREPRPLPQTNPFLGLKKGDS